MPSANKDLLLRMVDVLLMVVLRLLTMRVFNVKIDLDCQLMVVWSQSTINVLLVQQVTLLSMEPVLKSSLDALNTTATTFAHPAGIPSNSLSTEPAKY